MRKFKTESQRLLDLMINSIYTNKEIFLRELISNGSDALDKVYLTALQNGDDSVSRSSLAIDVAFDKEARTITVSDNGIGMDDAALETNLGTIAHSGSLEFKSDDEVKENDEVDVIGQFGVGFYASFMVASHVTVVSKPYGSDKAWKWESDGMKGYTISEAEREDRGTTITLKLRENTDDERYDRFLSEYMLRELIKRYSDYVRYPVRMETTEHVAEEKPEDAGDDWTPEYKEVKEVKTINSMVPIWTKKKSEVSDEEYNEFYKTTFHDTEDPLRVISIHAEGTISYDALLFIPSHAPQDLYSSEFKSGLQLYSSSVLIMDDCTDVLPECFGFVCGVVDSPDLSLNISREMLQQSRELKAIERRIEKKIKGELDSMLEDDRETYEGFFKDFGSALKFSIYRSYGVQAGLLGDLIMFTSAKEGKLVTLREYVDAMPEDQTRIYYSTGNAEEILAKAPAVRNVLGKGYDVLLGNHQVDEFCLLSMQQYDGKPFANAGGSDTDLASDEEKEQVEQAEKDNADLLAEMKAILGDAVSRVSASATLGDDTAAALAAGGNVSLAMEKYFQTLPDTEAAPKAEHVLEVNLNHPVLKALQAAFEAKDADKVEAYTKILHDQALLAEGFVLEDVNAFNAAICKLMA